MGRATRGPCRSGRDEAGRRTAEAPRLHDRDAIVDIARGHFMYAGWFGAPVQFEDCPILTKDRIYEAFTADAARATPRLRGSLYWSPSGGTTSTREFYFATDVRENTFQRQRFADALKMWGIFDEDTVSLNLHSSGGMYRGLEIHNDFVDRAGGTSLPVGFSSSDDRILQAIDRWRPNTVCAFPTRLAALAAHVEQSGRRVEVPTVISAGDVLHASTRSLVERALGARHCLQLYGSAETGIWAFQPHALEGTSAFVYDPLMIHAEIVDPDTSGFGRLIATNLIRARVPLLRYDTGDVGRLEVRELEGHPVHILHLRGRGAHSFQVGGNYYWLKDVERALGLGREPCEGAPTGVLAYQLVLSHDPGTRQDVLTCRVAVSDAAGAVARRAELLRRMWTVVPTRAVEIVALGTLTTDVRSGKVKRIVDLRG